MPEPYQPVDHLAVSRLVPVNSSSNLRVQSPDTPAGIGVRAAGLVDGSWSAHVTAPATMTRTAATSSHDRLPPSLSALKSPGRSPVFRPARGLEGAVCRMRSPWSCVVAYAGRRVSLRTDPTVGGGAPPPYRPHPAEARR